MEAELRNFILVWLSAIVFVSYCYYVSPKIKAGVFRFLSVLPVCALFLVLPLFFSSVHFSSSTAFYLSGFANLKLILFAFDQGPLLPLPPNLVHFICFTCFPIKLQQNPNSQNRFHKRAFAFRLFLFFLVLHVYKYSQTLPHYVLLGLCFVHLYLELEILLAPLKFLLSITLGCDLEPQFNEPYLATSLQDLWGRRWNLMVSAIFRSGVYNPVRGASRGLINSSWARFMGFFVTFLVSGLFHELVYFYITREAPKWEVTLFFVLNGVCTGTEVAVKRTVFFQRRLPVRPVVSWLLTMGFVAVTGGLLYFPQFIRSGMMERRANETLFFIDFVKRKFSIF
ncbi:LOW QUALITY PROTEIN: probable long-chain-alcohol O-fatty-acyltransferase 9 [Raphanus sativus]|uniref:long-chain-alcohol O-fatty-acyltransferase n=1 Tax=Raphanus sativus TaxID=3726 RepID=A0A6J0L5X7_RAPSA|nr:LOW QUALITY PROTEIN: probable long-chain-alcohol O-fatty-acyltransferase 9 [Raphanus sativus]